MTITGPAIGRLALLGLVAVDPAAHRRLAGRASSACPTDLSPLIVASVGFLCGSVPGAVFGFCFGLFADTALMQTLGVTSLVLTAVGYGAGRIRELRDPAHGLAPVAVGAAATAVAALGVTLLQFLLGVEAPVVRAGRAPDPDDDRAQHAARAAGLRASAAACCCRSCPTTRAAAGAARTRPAA